MSENNDGATSLVSELKKNPSAFAAMLLLISVAVILLNIEGRRLVVTGG